MTTFLVDARLPPALAKWIAAGGHSSQHLVELQMQAASDRAIWDCALNTNAVIITKDEDFARRKTLADGGPAIVWIRWPNTRRSELLSRFAEIFPGLLIALHRGETLVEIV